LAVRTARLAKRVHENPCRPSRTHVDIILFPGLPSWANLFRPSGAVIGLGSTRRAALTNFGKPSTQAGSAGVMIYFFVLAGLCGSIGAGIGGGASCCFTASEILSAFASSRLTCHICVSLRLPLNPGMPVKRIPFATFQ